ncbi:MAG: glycosyltransferase family 4 protein [Acidimicrobiales bacterium]
MRILTVANYLGARGGLERTQLTMCTALAGRGHQVDLIYVTPGDFADDWRKLTTNMVQAGGTLPRSQEPFISSRDVLDAARTAVRMHPDIIYVFRYLDLPFAAVVGKLARAPVVLHLCLPQPDVLPFVIRRSLTHVDMTLSVSFDTAELWRDTGLPAESVIVVHTGIDMEYYVPAPPAERNATRADLGIDADAFVALYAGRISPEKGLDVLITACRMVAATQPDFRLVVVGGPSVGAANEDSERYLASLRALCGPLDVLWLESRRDVLSLIQTADVALAPSIWPEPFSRSVIEPLACGVPVLASHVGGNPEILNGWLAKHLVTPGDPGDLAAHINQLEGWRRSDPDLADRCRQAVVDRLALGREVDTVEAALASLARDRTEPSSGAEGAVTADRS